MHRDKSRVTWHSIAYANEDLDASVLQNDWPDGLPRLIHRENPAAAAEQRRVEVSKLVGPPVEVLPSSRLADVAVGFEVSYDTFHLSLRQRLLVVADDATGQL
jgi:hypothetical protein